MFLTSVTAFADVSTTKIEKDIETDGSEQSDLWFTIFAKLLPQKAANGVKFYAVLTSLRNPILESQVGVVLDSDASRKARLAAYGLGQTEIYSMMRDYFNDFPNDMNHVEALEATPKVNLYADIYHDNDLKYSNYMLDFHLYLNVLFAKLPTQMKDPIHEWDRQGQGEIILYQDMMNQLIRTDIGIETYTDGSLTNQNFVLRSELNSILKAVILRYANNYPVGFSGTPTDEAEIEAYVQAFIDLGNVMLDAGEANLRASGELGNAFDLGKIIEVIRRQDFSTPAQPSLILNPTLVDLEVTPDENTPYTNTDQFTATILDGSGTVVWSIPEEDEKFLVIDQNGNVTVNEDFPENQPETITVELTASVPSLGLSETGTVIINNVAPLGSIQFYGAYISGYEDGTFRETRNITRAEAATMFVRVLNLENKTIEGTTVKLYTDAFLDKETFSDVDKEHWAHKYVEIAKSEGLMGGYSDDTFRPNDPMTRAEVAVLIANGWEALNITKSPVAKHSIEDVDSSHWAFEAINKVYNYNIVEGFEDHTFRPETYTTRAQVVIMINNMIDRDKIADQEPSFSDIEKNHWAFGDIEAATKEQIREFDLPTE
jgi:hypothetical protein